MLRCLVKNIANPKYKVDLTISAVQNPPAVFSSSIIFPQDIIGSQQGFLVPPYYFGSHVNEIGITNSAWMLGDYNM